MRNRIVWVGIIALLLGTVGLGCSGDSKKGSDKETRQGSQDAKQETDNEKLQGTWEVTKMVRNDEPAPKKKMEGMKFIFDGDKMIQEDEGEKTVAIYELDTSKKPKWIDLTFEGEDKPSPGIYEVDGGTLKLCILNGVGDQWGGGPRKRVQVGERLKSTHDDPEAGEEIANGYRA
jgi:uncharacterized protein (TIGR03067 family)